MMTLNTFALFLFIKLGTNFRSISLNLKWLIQSTEHINFYVSACVAAVHKTVEQLQKDLNAFIIFF